MEDQSETTIPGAPAESDVHEECRQRVADLEAKWKRARADYENREKELTREREDFAKFCTVDFIRGFLPIIDAVEAAGRHHPPTHPLPLPLRTRGRDLPEEGGGSQNVFSPARGEGE
ncbi:MAG: nucleotide exchange factor GrpE, partial [bacterium]|nr:nucleotide exchange factor GrpE [bacterium]